MSTQVETIPHDLQSLPTWVLWKLEPNPQGKLTKVPYHPAGFKASNTKPETWVTFETALKAMDTGYSGLGFEFGLPSQHSICGIDLDHVRSKETGEIEPEAIKIIEAFNSYTEISQSGEGIHILFINTSPPVAAKQIVENPVHMEIYEYHSYFALTGDVLEGYSEVKDCTTILKACRLQYGLPLTDKKAKATESPTLKGSDSEDDVQVVVSNPESDAQVLEQAIVLQPERFPILYFEGNFKSLGYPSQSEADLALCSWLAVASKGDKETVDRLFRKSKLYREKWERDDYREETLYKAVSNVAVKHAIYLSNTYTVYPVDPHESIGALEQDFILECLSDQEYGDAKLLHKLYSNRLLYSPEFKAWFLWEGHAWSEDKEKILNQLIPSQVAYQYNQLQVKKQRELVALTDKTEIQKMESLIKALRDRVTSLKFTKRIKNVTELSLSMFATPGIQWDSKPELLPVKNGVVDLRTGELTHGEPADYFKTVAPVEYKGLDESCTRFEQFMAEIFELTQDRNLVVSFMQRLLGYGITGYTTEHILPIWYGEEGRNGKDTLENTLKSILGDYAGDVPKDVIMDKKTYQHGESATPALMSLRGRRLVWANETEKGGRLDLSKMKLLTGGNTITGRKLHENVSSFTPTHLLCVVTNEVPEGALDSASKARIALIPFKMYFTDTPTAFNHRRKVLGLHTILLQEKSGILTWLVKGAMEYLHTGRLDMPEVLKQETANYFEEQDTIARFISQVCKRVEGEKVKAKDVYDAYVQFVKDEIGAGREESMQHFGRVFSKSFDTKRFTTGNYYLNLMLPQDESTDVKSNGFNGNGHANKMAPLKDLNDFKY